MFQTDLHKAGFFKYQIMTSGIISGDQAAVKRLFSLISRPLNDFKDLYYPSFAEWVTCKVFEMNLSYAVLCLEILEIFICSLTTSFWGGF